MRWWNKLIWRHALILDGEQLQAHFDGYDWRWHLREDIAQWATENTVGFRIDWRDGWHPGGLGYTRWPWICFRRAKDAILFKLRWM
mgnify:CR=1 FL=1